MMTVPSSDHRGFASDNHSGAHEAVLQAVVQANRGHVPSYGDDPVTQAATELFREHFGEVDVFFVLNGTGANVLSLRALTRSHHAIICAATSHLQVDECGAPEFFTGCKVLPVSSRRGKVRCEDIEPLLVRRGDQHYAQPRVISVAQATEYGTVYTPEELHHLACFAHDNGLLLHIDGARLCNAAASLETSLRGISVDVGADVLSFGGTKNGMMLGEAVVFCNRDLVDGFKFLRKESMQLCSKMRFVAAQFVALLSDGLWRQNAMHANAMARLLAEKVSRISAVQITQPVQANAVFARIPERCIQPLMDRFHFYIWDERTLELRWMTSFDTQPEDIDAFVGAVADLV